MESSSLMPALHRRFTVLEEHPYGSILHLPLHGIAHNFLADDPGTTQVIQACLAAEDQALPRLGADFTYAVCSPALSSDRTSGGARHDHAGQGLGRAGI